jgi:hypothetical protein
MAAREEQVSTGEPILTRSRRAQPNGKGKAVRVNITREGRDILDIEPGDDLEVEIYGDHIRLVPSE